MIEKREGGTVRLAMEQKDEDGKAMWELKRAWHGFSNEGANLFVKGMIKAISDYTQSQSRIKNADA